MLYTWKQKLNVFAAVPYDSEIDPHSRTMHTSLLQKLKAVFQSIIGGKTFVGSFDYLIIPGLLDKLMHTTTDIWRALDASQATFLGKVGQYTIKVYLAIAIGLVGLAHIVVNLVARYAVALVVTAALLPFIALAHCISQIVRQDKAEKVTAKIRVIPVNKENRVVGDTATVLQAFLATEKIAVPDMDVERKNDICYLLAPYRRFIFLDECNRVIQADDPLMYELAAAASTNVRQKIMSVDGNVRAISLRV